jgi:hypothetical protein
VPQPADTYLARPFALPSTSTATSSPPHPANAPAPRRRRREMASYRRPSLAAKCRAPYPIPAQTKASVTIRAICVAMRATQYAASRAESVARHNSFSIQGAHTGASRLLGVLTSRLRGASYYTSLSLLPGVHLKVLVLHWDHITM